MNLGICRLPKIDDLPRRCTYSQPDSNAPKLGELTGRTWNQFGLNSNRLWSNVRLGQIRPRLRMPQVISSG
jgi:hypothetical protein